MASIERNMNAVKDQGRELIEEGIPGSEQIHDQLANIEEMWNALKRLADLRKQRLLGAVDYYQVRRQGSLNLGAGFTLLLNSAV